MTTKNKRPKLPGFLVSFSTSKEERTLIDLVIDRLERIQPIPDRRMTFVMDITACHANGNPLRLHDLLDADEFNFMHDVMGIHHNIDRRTGKLMNHFLPRFSQPQRKSA